VPQPLKKQRRAELNSILTGISLENNMLEIGSQRNIMIKEVQTSAIIGYTDNMKNIIVHPRDDVTLNSFGLDSFKPG
jgi:tRNA A37 methylthiotransferase MiaB